MLGLLLLATLWQALSMYIGQKTMVFPDPVSTIKYALYLLGRPYTYRCIFSTMGKMLMGFAISMVIGVILGVIAGNNGFIEKIISPTIITLRAIPTASLIYVFIVLAGFRLAPMFLVVLICFPIIYEGTAGGIRNIPDQIIKASKVDGSGYFMGNLRIKLPLAFPYILVAMLSSFSLAFKIEIMAEVITGGSNPGLGSAILGARSSDPTNMIPIFAYSLIAVMIMLMIDLVSGLIGRSRDLN